MDREDKIEVVKKSAAIFVMMAVVLFMLGGCGLMFYAMGWQVTAGLAGLAAIIVIVGWAMDQLIW